MADAPRTTLSLTGRIALAMASVLLLGGVLVLVLALAYGRHAAREAYDRLLLGAANDIAESIAIRDGHPIVDLPVSAFNLLSLAEADRIDYRVVGRDGATLTGRAGAPRPEGETPSLYAGRFGAEPARYAAVTRRFAERGYAGPVQVIVGHTTRARRALAREIAQNALAGVGAAGLAVAVFAGLAVLSALRPTGRIGAALNRRDPTDLTPLTYPAPREIAYLRDALNGFMARLDRQLRANRDLISDTAHQLRTPLTAIRVQLDAAEDEPDPARRAVLIGRVQTRLRGLSRLLDQLLSQGMVIHRGDSAPKDRLDLREVALEICEQIDPAPARLDLPEAEMPVRGDRLSLAEAGKNLLSNALTHGTAPVALGVVREGGAIRLWVRDAGPGPTPERLARIGDRFAPSGMGNGLGLAIARAVADDHGGRLVPTPGPAGFEIALVLPADGPP